MCFPYMQTLRMNPPTVLGGVRQSTEPVTVLGKTFAPGTCFWLASYPLLHSQHNWARPMDFWPERWQHQAEERCVMRHS